MKVTALIPDELVKEVRQFSSGKNLSESLIIALKEWSSIQKLKALKKKIKKKPIQFSENFSADSVRSLNR